MTTEAFNPVNHLQDAVEDDIQQIIDAWEGTDPVPLNLVVNDATATALKVTNTSGGYALDVYGPARFSSTLSTAGGPIFDVKNGYEADNTGVTACDAEFAAAIAAIPAAGGRLYVPAGTYLLSGAVTIDKPVYMYGDGRGATFIKTSSTTANMFNVTAASGKECTFDGLYFGTTVTKTDGAYIKFTPGSGAVVEYTLIKDCQFQGGWTGADMTDAPYFTISNCIFHSYRFVGVIVDCTVNADAGDSLITDNCQFSGVGVNPSYGILQRASGGLKIIGNKGNQPGNAFYFLDLRAGAVTSGLSIVGNNIEAASVAQIAFAQNGGSGGYSNIVIADNKMGGSLVDISVSTAGNWLKGLSITGNNTVLGANKFVSLTGGYDVLIEGNLITDATTGSVLLENSAGASVVRLGKNWAPSVESWYTGPAPLLVDPDIQHGAFAGSTNAAYAGGALFTTADITVTFPSPFMSAPTVVASASGAAGAYNGVIAVAIKSIAADSFVCCIIGQTNGQTVTGQYSAYGIMDY